MLTWIYQAAQYINPDMLAWICQPGYVRTNEVSLDELARITQHHSTDMLTRICQPGYVSLDMLAWIYQPGFDNPDMIEDKKTTTNLLQIFFSTVITNISYGNMTVNYFVTTTYYMLYLYNIYLIRYIFLHFNYYQKYFCLFFLPYLLVCHYHN